MRTTHTPPEVADRGSAGRAARSQTRDELIFAHMGLVKSLARRYANRGESLDDLIQVGMIGLIKAADRFDPGRDVAFPSFATPTIVGEIRRHFRDRTWAVRVPRGLQEANARVTKAVDELTRTLRRSPSVSELTESCGLSESEVLEALAVGAAYRPAPLITEGPDGEETMIDVAVEDPGFAAAEGRALLGQVVGRLPRREQRILVLRYSGGLSQAEIGARLGISQMHVSRLLAKSIRSLRAGLGLDPPATFAGVAPPRH